MKLTDEHRDLLEAAQLLIEQGAATHICLALEVISHPSEWVYVAEIKDAIRIALDDNLFLTTWTMRNGYRHDDLHGRGVQDMMRMAWIDKMLHDGEIR